MNTKSRKVEVPGVEPAPEANSAPSTPQAPDPSEDQARTDAANAQVEATRGLVGSDKALDWGHLTTPNAILNKINHNPDDDLPSVDSIDWKAQPKSVNRVLTRQGWLLRPE